ncbi:hypothetical protein N7535_009244 [Penicillium sp. DV-2018c]|nr:hypothetical protein N7535_009244 [Penicillium sp. DV-2018c]
MSSAVGVKEDSLYLRWSSVMMPGDTLEELLQNKEHARALFHGLRRQVKSILQRSQLYADGEVTIYDRVLLRLFDEGHSMQAYGLFDFYLAEYLGTKNCDTKEEINSILAAHFAAQSILDKGSLFRFTVLLMHINDNLPGPIPEIPVTPAPIVKHQTGDTKTGKAPQSADKQKLPNLDKLIKVYHEAKADYDHVLEVPGSHREQTNSVRFLRDTAENLLRYLNSFDPDHELIPEIENVIRVSKHQALVLAGGRKRKFERLESDSWGSPTASSYRERYSYRGRDRYEPGTEKWDAESLYPDPRQNKSPQHSAYPDANELTAETGESGKHGRSQDRADTHRSFTL